MPRTARIVDPSGGTYHITCRGNNRKPVFKDRRDFSTYIHMLRELKRRYGFRLLHYVLMTNHVHLIVQPKSGFDLRHVMKSLNQGYSLHWKRRYGHIGHLWQDRYKSPIIGTDAHLLTAGIYVELNPVRAGMTISADTYEWSSHMKYAYDHANALVDLSPVYINLSTTDIGRQEAYRALTAMWRAMPKPGKGTVPGLARQGTVPLGKVK